MDSGDTTIVPRTLGMAPSYGLNRTQHTLTAVALELTHLCGTAVYAIDVSHPSAPTGTTIRNITFSFEAHRSPFAPTFFRLTREKKYHIDKSFEIYLGSTAAVPR